MGSSVRASSSGGVVLIFLTLIVASLLRAQENGAIRLGVKDPSGAAVEASGTLRNLDNGTEQPFRTNAQGSFDFSNLRYGRYRIRVVKDGFSAQTVQVQVRSAAPVEQTVTLTLRSQTT